MCFMLTMIEKSYPWIYSVYTNIFIVLLNVGLLFLVTRKNTSQLLHINDSTLFPGEIFEKVLEMISLGIGWK